MSTELLTKPLRPRRSRAAVAATAAAVTGVMVFLAAQGIGTAAAGTNATKADFLEGCPSGQACLWINAPDDPNPAKAADKRALVITEGSGPDISDTTPYGKGKVHGMTEEFTDNVSVGWNLLPSYDLCLMDTTFYEDVEGKYDTDADLRSTSFIMVVKPQKAFAQLEDKNDTIDFYSTAPTGKCPRGGVVFRTDTQEIVDSW
jgi:hypothetical protein